MNIKPVVYENLSNHERIIASLEALARGDIEEKEKLAATCPKKSYLMNDMEFCHRMNVLLDMMMAVECDMRGYALNFFMLMWLEDNVDLEKWDKVYDFAEKQPEQLIDLISTQKAWHELLEENDIPPKIMQRDFKHFALKFALHIADEMGLEPDPDRVCEFKTVFHQCLEREA